MKSPRDCRAPIVTIRMAAAANVTTHAARPLPSLLDDMPTVHIQFPPRLVSLSTRPAAPLKRCNGYSGCWALIAWYRAFAAGDNRWDPS